jgi:hypothetical protein
MRKTLLPLLAAALLASAAAAHAGPVSPAAPPQGGTWDRLGAMDGGGFRLFYDSTRYGRTSERVDLAPYGSLTLSDSVTVRSLQASVLYVTLEEGLFEKGRSSVSIGAADFSDGDGFEGGFAPFAEGSTGGVFLRDERRRIDYGLSLLAGVSKGYEATASEPFPLRAEVRFPWYAAVALGAQHEYRTNVTVYGGAMVRYGMAQVNLKAPAGDRRYRLTERGYLGLYGGVSARIARGLRAEGEIQARGILDPSGIQEGISGGVTLVWFPGATAAGEEAAK